MMYSDNTNKTGIVQDIDFICNTTDYQYPIADKTRNANKAMDKVTSIIMKSDGTWNWGDSNYTDLPIGETDLVSGQQQYSFGTDQLNILKVEVKDSNGNWQPLNPISINDFTNDETLAGYQTTNRTPSEYLKMENVLMLYPAPSYASTKGLRVYFQRQSDYFVYTDTTKVPGFDEIFHSYISNFASYEYARIHKQDIVKPLLLTLQTMEEDMKVFYTLRSKDQNPKLIPVIENTE